LSRIIGKGPSIVCQYEAGNKTPRVDVLEKLAGVLRVSCHALAWFAYAKSQPTGEFVKIDRQMRKYIARMEKALGGDNSQVGE
jgi:transcriptional regulator with XRE-family HTH domain